MCPSQKNFCNKIWVSSQFRLFILNRTGRKENIFAILVKVMQNISPGTYHKIRNSRGNYTFRGNLSQVQQ